MCLVLSKPGTVHTPLSSIHVFKSKLHLPLEVLLHLSSFTERLEYLRRHRGHLVSSSQPICLLHVLKFHKQALTILQKIVDNQMTDESLFSDE